MTPNQDLCRLREIQLRVERLLTYYRSSITTDQANVAFLEQRLAGISSAIRRDAN